MKIAVSGASGFIGQHVLAELSKQDMEVVAITRDAAKLQGLATSVRVVEMDLAQPENDCYERLGKPDVLIHLAWEGLPNYKSLHHFETELPRQYQFLKQLITAGLPSLFVTGTCFEYGMQSGSLAAGAGTKPDNPYGHAKDTLRQQLEYLKRTRPFNLTWGRLFYMYGEGQSSNSLYSKLQEAVLRSDKIFNMSGGEQLRDYLAVEQVAQKIAHLAIAQRDIGAINICSGEPISVRRLVESWLQNNNWQIELNLGYYPYPDYEPLAFWGDATIIEGND
jgi:dTDP-6-deoxy-L-talose 4-dehydrogenase (NAD+)